MKSKVMLMLVVGLALSAVLLAQTPPNASPGITVKPTATAPATAPATASAPALEKKDVSYAVGIEAGKRFLMEIQMSGIDLDVADMLEGIQDGLGGKPARLSDAQVQAGLEEAKRQADATRQSRMREAETQRAEQGDKNKAEGEAFLAKNATREGVKTLPDGLQYEVIKQGDGPKPEPTDVVKVHYRGTFIDGSEFDSSYKRNEPATFPLNGVIKGWTEGVALMPVGSKYKLYIPSDLAYGPQGRGAKVPPNSLLIFEVELLEIVAKPGSPASGPATTQPTR